MAINWNALQNIQAPQVIGELPSAAPSDGGGGLGEIFSGLAGLAGGFKNGGATQQAASGINPSGPQNAYTASAFGQGASLDGRPRLEQLTNQNIQELYQRPAFQTALEAQKKALDSGVTKSPIMTVVDYSLPSNQPRLWTVDTSQNKVLMNTYVAQGKEGFSNIPGSKQSSLGTFLATNPYESASLKKQALKLQGLDAGINDKAFERGIVIHGGNYVGPDKNGTSWGCFTVPNEVAPKLIGLTKGGTIVHAYAPDQKALNKFSNTLSPEGRNSLKTQISSFKQGSDTSPNNEIYHIKQGIQAVETPGYKNPYSVLGKPLVSGRYKGSRAYGKYQVMDFNIPSWTKAARGVPMTPQQFLNSPEAQEAVMDWRIKSLISQGYSPQDIASIHFSGQPFSKAKNRADQVTGMTVPAYINKFDKGYLRSKESRTTYARNPGPLSQNNSLPSTTPFPGSRPPVNGPLTSLAMNNVGGPNPPTGQLPNVRAFDPKFPAHNLTPREIELLMRTVGPYRPIG